MSFGMKVSQPGYKVTDCADWQLLYSSEWPLLKTAFEGSITLPDATADVTIKTHGLGYVPAFWAFDTSTYAGAWSGVKFAYPGASQYLAMGTSSLDWKGSRGAGAGSISLRYLIFRHNLATTYAAPVTSHTTGTQGTYSPYGVRVSKPSKSAHSTDYRDFSLRSDCRSPLVHMAGTGSLGGAGSTTITHNLGYEPMFFVWASLAINADSKWQPIGSASDGYATATPTQITLNINYECDYSYLILKDPMLI